MKRVEPQSAVKIRYQMKSHLRDGTIKQRPEELAEFIYKIQPQVPALERALDGAAVGDRFKIRIPSSEMYGEYNPALVKEIPKKGLVTQRIKEGQFYRQMRKGCLVSFKIMEIRGDKILADFNTPMAGIWVEMEIEVQEVREASEEEIAIAREAQAKKDIGCG